MTRFEIGNPAAKFASASDAGTTLGEPDNDPRTGDKPELPQNYLTLGCGGILTLQFRDNALVDVPGPDLYVFEIGGHVEATHLSISISGKDWIDVGTIKGGLAAVDISKISVPGTQYGFVRLQDAKEHCDSRWPGADIDAVGAIGSVSVANGQLRLNIDRETATTATQIGLILDASGSMRGKLGGEQTKMQIAKNVLRSVVSTLPNDAKVGLRVYGHRLPSRPKEPSCSDSELVVPFGLVNRGRLIGAIDAVNAGGQTPIGRSLALLSEDFGADPGFKLIVLVSDGIETCSPKLKDQFFPLEVVRSLQASGFKFRINVVGFDITQSESRRLLREIAQVSGGQYFAARDSGELEAAIREAVELGYRIKDTSGETVAAGRLTGEPIELPPGRYTVFVQSQPEIRISDVEIKGGIETRLTVRRGGQTPQVERTAVPMATSVEE